MSRSDEADGVKPRLLMKNASPIDQSDSATIAPTSNETVESIKSFAAPDQSLLGWSFLKNYQFWDVFIKAFAVGGAYFTYFFYYKPHKDILKKQKDILVRKTNYDFYRDFYNDFLGPDILEKRDSVAKFWTKTKLKKLQTGGTTISVTTDVVQTALLEPDVQELIKAETPKQLLSWLKKYYQCETDEINDYFLEEHDKFIKLTEEILNRYEHLGKLVKHEVIEEKDIKTFFYTMIGDTFVICAPFIAYRRNYKLQYAHKMQDLIRLTPNISKDILRV